MQQPDLFAAPPVITGPLPKVEAPWQTQATQTPAQCSYEGAKAAAPSIESQQHRMLEMYRLHGSLTDWEMHDLTDIERTTVIPRRRELMKLGLVTVDGKKPGPFGNPNTTYKRTAAVLARAI